jgi:hypothetical protein
VKPLHLKPHEARELLKGSALIVRPVEPQPPFHGHKEVWCHELDRYETDWGFFDEDREYVCPLGKPGSETWGRETYWMDWREPGVVVYDATPEWEIYRGNGEPVRSTTLDGQTMSREQSRDAMPPEFWARRSPATMPRWASRFPRLAIATARACRLSGLTEAECLAYGVRLHHSKICGEDVEWYATDGGLSHIFADAAMMEQWDRDYPKFPAASDPWVWAAMVERRTADV